MHAVVVSRPGDSSVLEYREWPDPTPGPGEVAVAVAAAGVNFIDVYQREGRYPLPLPFVPGGEGAGTVVEVGSDVADLSVGDRVAWGDGRGSYAERVVLPAAKAVRLPEGVDPETGGAVMLQGMTAHYLTTSTYAIQPGDDVLVHAAAGGMGLLLTQLAKLRGARVIGTVSTDEKEKQAREAGADDVLRYDGFATAVRDLTGGAGVHVAYDGVGRDTYEGSLASLRPRGMLALYGGASGPVPPIDPLALRDAGSVFLTRPMLGHYIATREEFLARANDLFDWIASGALKVRISQRHPLADARQAHDDLESRRTTGKLLLIP